jgi:hypothetical protein
MKRTPILYLSQACSSIPSGIPSSSQGYHPLESASAHLAAHQTNTRQHAATINQLASAETTPGTPATATPKRMAKEVESFIVAWSWR